MRQVSNDKFAASHGKSPRGTGCWWFGNRSESWTWRTPTAMNVTEAKKAAVKQANSDGMFETVFVMP